MKQYNLLRLTDAVKKWLLSYMCSSLPLGNHSSQARLGQEFYRRWENDTFQGPYLETVPSYRRPVSLRQKFEANAELGQADKRFCNLFHPRYEPDDLLSSLSRLGVGSTRIEPYLMAEDGLRTIWERPLYEHQLEAFGRLSSRPGNLVVATGTGSGKTECFLLPLMYWLLTESDEVRKQPGVRALLLFPMNALVEDQIRRLRAVLCSVNGQSRLPTGPGTRLAREITFGRYVGATRVNRNDSSPERRDPDDHIAELGEMLYREDMQKVPPDILVTNFTMLEYMLLRNDDRRLFSRPELFRLILLDEIHTYRGTQGMEVACLLRRFDDLLHRSASSRRPEYVRVGLSATLPGDMENRKLIAKFASELFGTGFTPESIIVEPGIIHNENSSRVPGPWPRVPSELGRLSDLVPTFCRAFAINCPDEGNDEGDEIPLEEWQLVAAVLESSYVPSLENMDDERVEILGRILERSPVAQGLRDFARREGVASLSSVAEHLFGQAVPHADQRCAIGLLLQLMCAARLKGEALLPLRAHYFVKEHKEAQICINPLHGTSEIETDPWWKALYVAHHSSCGACGATVFPLNLCRRCGFVLLEAWLRKGHYFPERDGLMTKNEFTRVFFRPLAGIPDDLDRKFRQDPPTGNQVQEFLLCTKCGLRIFRGPHGEVAAATHPCGQNQLVPILEWSSPGTDVCISRCPHCEQEWYQGQEVFTPPALSPYGAASILLEEIKRAVDAPLTHSINKVLCFSDSRQQAAKIARRLGRTNEEFAFRQLVFQALASSPSRLLSTPELLDSVLRACVTDIGLAELFCERTESPRDRELLKRRIATLLLRELCTEYLTLERMGIVEITYPEAFEKRGAEAVATCWLGKRMCPSGHRALFRFLFDWVFRLNRWAVSPGIFDVEYERLSFYGYRDKAVALRGVTNGPIGFLMSHPTSRSRRLDFYIRVSRSCGSSAVSIPDLQSFNELAEGLWARAISSPDSLTRTGARTGLDPSKPLVILQGMQSQDYRLKLNFEAINWSLTDEEELIFRCSYCQYVTRLNVRDVCPVRGCGGKLHTVTLRDLRAEQFSPSRHYMELITARKPKPLWVEEHTAQISPARRAEIEREFRDDSPGSLDVVSGSTTFELGVDLGTINAVFLANLPPEISNYRQRAGRAGRRPGMMPFILSYVRERPHDKYFWSNVRDFIGGPLRAPWLSPPSREIVLRHTNAVICARLLEVYNQTSGLQGPPCGQFAAFCLNQAQRSKLRAEAGISGSHLTGSLRSVLRINPLLGVNPPDCVEHFLRTVDFNNSRYFGPRSDEGSINVFCDYAILPSYSFPIYVDELVLYQRPRTERPRRDLKLQRDRKIALREYFPGRTIEADKWVLESVGLRNGYEEQVFAFCSACRRISKTAPAGACATEGCSGQYRACRAVIPKGGFLGQVLQRPAAPDLALFELQTSEVIFDPASDPPPPLDRRGHFLLVASQSAARMTEARMRMFSPRPASENGLELAQSGEVDVAEPSKLPSTCLLMPGKAAGGNRAQPKEYYLMHEFTTDILRLQFSSTAEKILSSSRELQAMIETTDPEERQKARTILLYTLGQALTTGAARHLRVDPAELDFTLRFVPGDVALKTEFIIFDTAPGGAGYASKCFDGSELKSAFKEALLVLNCHNKCGDSCYDCLRTYGNQWMHARLNRKFAREGLEGFINTNWSG